MTVFTATLTTTAMLLAALLMGRLHSLSQCSYKKWQNEIIRVGEHVKDHPSLRIHTVCSGATVHWNFQGSLHAR